MPREANRVAETATTVGTGTITLAGAISGHQAFGTAFGVSGSVEVPYAVMHDSDGSWESGYGTYLGTTNQLQRDNVIESSTGGGPINFAVGSKTVYVGRLADMVVMARCRRATDIGVEVRAAPGQTANALEVWNGAGVRTVAMTAAGGLSLAANLSVSGFTSYLNHVEVAANIATNYGDGAHLAWPDAGATQRVALRVNSGALTLGNANYASQRLTGDWGALAALAYDDWISTDNDSGWRLTAGVMQVGRSSAAGSTVNLFAGYSGGVNSVAIRANGNVLNTNNSYGAISDAQVKTAIVDATPKLDDVLALQVRNFRLVGSDLTQIGLIAQEVEPIFPGLVEMDPESGLRSLKYSVLTPILIKAVQELTAQVATLEARVADLEA